MSDKRIDRLNSLLKQVIADVILKEVKNPHLPPLITITKVEVTKDLSQAKVYVSVIGDKGAKERALDVLKNASGFIAARSSKQVVMRYFPNLIFILDDAAEKLDRIDQLLQKIHREEDERSS